MRLAPLVEVVACSLKPAAAGGGTWQTVRSRGQRRAVSGSDALGDSRRGTTRARRRRSRRGRPAAVRRAARASRHQEGAACSRDPSEPRPPRRTAVAPRRAAACACRGGCARRSLNAVRAKPARAIVRLATASATRAARSDPQVSAGSDSRSRTSELPRRDPRRRGTPAARPARPSRSRPGGCARAARLAGLDVEHGLDVRIAGRERSGWGPSAACPGTWRTTASRTAPRAVVAAWTAREALDASPSARSRRSGSRSAARCRSAPTARCRSRRASRSARSPRAASSRPGGPSAPIGTR